MADNGDNRVLYKPQNQSECDEVIKMIMQKRSKQHELNTPNGRLTSGLDGQLIIEAGLNTLSQLRCITNLTLNAMAKAKMNLVVFKKKPKVRRPGCHAKTKISKLKTSKNYVKKYRGQGR